MPRSPRRARWRGSIRGGMRPSLSPGDGPCCALPWRTPGGRLPSEAEVLAALEGRLARFKQPKRVLFADELPRNTMGKVQKNLLRDRFADLYRG